MRGSATPEITNDDKVRFLRHLELAGLDSDLVQRIAGAPHNSLAIKMVSMARLLGCNTVSEEYAKTIMGKNFFGLSEAVRHFGVRPSKRDVEYLASVPFSEQVLRAHRDTHILVAVFPLSVVDIRSKMKHSAFFEHENAWYSQEPCATERGRLEWKLVCKKPAAGSTSKDWDAQQTFLRPVEAVPSLRVMVYTIIGHLMETGEYLFENMFVRCADTTSNGRRAVVGHYGVQGLMISNCADTSVHENKGIATSLDYEKL